MKTKSWQFINDEGKKYVNGKAAWPDTISFDLDTKAALSIIETLSRSIYAEHFIDKEKLNNGLHVLFFEGKLDRLDKDADD